MTECKLDLTKVQVAKLLKLADEAGMSLSEYLAFVVTQKLGPINPGEGSKLFGRKY